MKDIKGAKSIEPTLQTAITFCTPTNQWPIIMKLVQSKHSTGSLNWRKIKMKITLTKEILNLWAFASNDEARAQLKGVFFDHENKTAVATNGHYLAQAPIKEAERSILKQ